MLAHMENMHTTAAEAATATTTATTAATTTTADEGNPHYLPPTTIGHCCIDAHAALFICFLRLSDGKVVVQRGGSPDVPAGLLVAESES